MEADIDYLICYRSGLNEVLPTKKMNEGEYEREMETLDNEFKPMVKELQLLKHEPRYLEEIIDDEYRLLCKSLKLNEDAQNCGLMERAYVSVLVSKVMSATGK